MQRFKVLIFLCLLTLLSCNEMPKKASERTPVIFPRGDYKPLEYQKKIRVIKRNLSSLNNSVIKDVVPTGYIPSYTYKHGTYLSSYNKTHVGTDIWGTEKDPVFSMAWGYVTRSYSNTKLGNVIIIRHPALGKNHQDLYSLYLHLNSRSVSVGNEVTAGQQIGTLGKTGTAANKIVHLHFELRYFSEVYYTSWANIYGPGDLRNDAVLQQWEDPERFDILTRSETIRYILQELNITADHIAPNGSIFGKPVPWPTDVFNSPDYRSIVTAYNRGISSSSTFRPDDGVNRAEFLTMLSRAIPLYPNNPSYTHPNFADVSTSDWFYRSIRSSVNTGVWTTNNNSATHLYPQGSVSKDELDRIMKQANIFLSGSNSGLNIYIEWTDKGADFDVYLINSSNAAKYNNTSLIVSNLSSLQSMSQTCYWNRNLTNWGAMLDYDSWGGQHQPWQKKGEERITVDSTMLRSGSYQILVNYYDWRNSNNGVKMNQPATAKVRLWGIYRGININSGGNKFEFTMKPGETRFVATLNIP